MKAHEKAYMYFLFMFFIVLCFKMLNIVEFIYRIQSVLLHTTFVLREKFIKSAPKEHINTISKTVSLCDVL